MLGQSPSIKIDLNNFRQAPQTPKKKESSGKPLHKQKVYTACRWTKRIKKKIECSYFKKNKSSTLF